MRSQEWPGCRVVDSKARTGIKFCGITRPEDAAFAARLGAAYVGVIFAESPRKVDDNVARAVFETAGASAGHVVVFPRLEAGILARRARQAGADVAQLHYEPTPEEIASIRKEFDGEIWAVLSVTPGWRSLPERSVELAAVADAVLIDTRVGEKTGGTGQRFDWEALADEVVQLRESTRVVLAGGLTPENVAAAVYAMRPSIVDVSSGVERSPGVKDPERMTAFAEAVSAASIVGRRNTPP